MTIETSPSIENLAAAFGKFQSETHGVVRDATNPFLKNRYATLEAVIETARPALAKAGLAFLQAPKGKVQDSVALETMLMHGASGEWIRFDTILPLTKADPQGVGSAITYACRYALMAMLGLPPLDDDAEATKPQPKQKGAPEPSNAPERQVRDTGTIQVSQLQGTIPPPTHDSRSIYVQNSLELIREFQNLSELNEWLDVEAEHAWPAFGITMHHDDGKAVLMACKKRRLELQGLPPKDARGA